jgi:hypothetical protein
VTSWDKQALLETASFGRRIAEEERGELATYFVETDQWRRLASGEIDVVYGAKGSGKSALYSLLVEKADEFFDRGILIVPGEHPSGTPVFEGLVTEPPTSEEEFIGLWKTYFLSLVANVLQEWDVQTNEATVVYRALEEAGLLKRDRTLQALLRAVRDYVKRADTFEAGMAVDPTLGTPTALTGKITLREPTGAQLDRGFVSLDSLLLEADAALAALDFEVWVVLDRLDVAFAQHEQLEKNALRAVFKAYLDMGALQNVSTKIFLRSDIWLRITEEEGFREGSHITRTLTISWNERSLRHLLLRRILKNEPIARYYGVIPDSVFGDVDAQEAFTQRMLPDQVDAGRNPKTFAWMVSRTADGSTATAPRELIHLASSLRDHQLKRLELGHESPPGEELFDRQSFKDALREVSEVRLVQTLYAEYPNLKTYIERLKREKAEQRASTLASIWNLSEAEAEAVAIKLVSVGLFERRGSNAAPSYWVPFLYRDALELVQGTARE